MREIKLETKIKARAASEISGEGAADEGLGEVQPGRWKSQQWYH